MGHDPEKPTRCLLLKPPSKPGPVAALVLCPAPDPLLPLLIGRPLRFEKLGIGIGGRGGALSSLHTGNRHLFALHALKPATALTAICTMPKPPAAAAALGHYLICPNPNTNWNGRRNANDEGGDGAGDVIRAPPCVQVLERPLRSGGYNSGGRARR